MLANTFGRTALSFAIYSKIEQRTKYAETYILLFKVSILAKVKGRVTEDTILV